MKYLLIITAALIITGCYTIPELGNNDVVSHFRALVNEHDVCNADSSQNVSLHVNDLIDDVTKYTIKCEKPE